MDLRYLTPDTGAFIFVSLKLYITMVALCENKILQAAVSIAAYGNIWFQGVNSLWPLFFLSYLSKTTVNNNKKTHYLTITIDVVNINRFHNYQNNQSVTPEKLSQNSYCFITVHVVCSICTSTVHREDLLQFCITIEWHTCINI